MNEPRLEALSERVCPALAEFFSRETDAYYCALAFTDASGRVRSFLVTEETAHSPILLNRGEYEDLEHTLSLIYDHVTRGRISKPNTDVREVITLTDELEREFADQEVAECTKELETEAAELRRRVGELQRVVRGIASTANANKHMHEKAMRNTLGFIEERALAAFPPTSAQAKTPLKLETRSEEELEPGG